MYQEVCNYQVLNMYQGCVLLGKYSPQYVPTTEHVPGLYARKVYCTRQPYQCTVPYRTKEPYRTRKAYQCTNGTIRYGTLVRFPGTVRFLGTVRYGTLVRSSGTVQFLGTVRYGTFVRLSGTVHWVFRYTCSAQYDSLAQCN